MIPFTKKLAYVYIIKKIELNFCYIKKNFMYIYKKSEFPSWKIYVNLSV